MMMMTLGGAAERDREAAMERAKRELDRFISFWSDHADGRDFVARALYTNTSSVVCWENLRA